MKTGASRVPLSQTTGPALALGIGVVTWEQFLHHAASPVHLLLDAALVLPLAIAAVSIGRFAQTRARATTTSIAFCALLVPASRLHHAAHAAVHDHIAAPANWITHATRDAALAFPVSLAIAAFAFGSRPTLRGIRISMAAVFAVTALPLAAQGAPAITPFAVPLPIPQTLTDANITLTAAQTDVPILPGAPTTMWTFNGSFPGPTIRRPSGEPTHVTVANNLPSDVGAITVHHHGEHAESKFDGQPHSNLIQPGGSYTYDYDFTEGGTAERGAFQWYHDHHMDVTGRDVWMGLAGMVILDDPAEASVNAALPNGDRDVPLMVVDRTFNSANQMPYAFNPEGNLGNAILVNGAPQPYFDVADVKYRLRILNASNMRDYDFSLSDGRPMVQVATESGLLPAPVSRTHLLLGPAERAEVIVDFSGEQGRSVDLLNSAGFGLNLSKAMRFNVTSHADDASTIPQTLRAAPAFDDPIDPAATRSWVFGRDPNTGEWTINNHGFDPDAVDATPRLGTVERWVFTNTTEVDHIVHIHDVDWHIVSRIMPDDTLADGLPGESSLRESFRLRPNEVVVVESRFTDHVGRYVLHCHILEHEDRAMMTQFEVTP